MPETHPAPAQLGASAGTVYRPRCACGAAVCCDHGRHHAHNRPEQCETADRQTAAIALVAHCMARHGMTNYEAALAVQSLLVP